MTISPLNRESSKRQSGIKGFFYWWLENDNNKRKWFIDIILMTIIFCAIFFTIQDMVLDNPSETINLHD